MTDTSVFLHLFLFAPPAPLVLAAALALDARFGEMGPLFRIVPHPVVMLGTVIGRADDLLNRPSLSPAVRRLLGVLVLVKLVGLFGLAGLAIHHLCAALPLGWVFEAFCAAVLLAGRSLLDHVQAVRTALDTGGLNAGRLAVQALVSRDTASMDEAAISRAAIESLSENFCDALVSPALWLLVGGLPGLFAFKAVSTLDSMIGYRTERHGAFGWASARLDDVANWPGARLSALLLAGGALLPPWGPRHAADALRVALRDHALHRSPNGGWPESAMAGVLGICLGGPRVYPGEPVQDLPWLGSGRTDTDRNDIGRALDIYRRGWWLVGAGALAVLAARIALI
ncbi:cobalamin biosynthesis protein CobD [Phaeovibrio sulfidiphilus]|uniref:Cobalamin biosynthesis protein CobD n=1 Tax=Phaeovibrio sulfidiphilus TaxID=1220600 RepID=A0A8J6YNJ4_9PROT|nr:adenosylcobinamide-phosphate synthase CbiB [Phaeovibrio sulfidiphilus]MBE1237885.1 cobalamin biosynthesis protein CobD [Phaeovibrio sulfidiphilus]